MDTRQRMSNLLPLLLGTALVLGFLAWAKSVVVPVALAVLFTFLLATLSGWLERRRVPRALAVAGVTLVGMGLVVALFYGVTRQIGSLLDEYPKYEDNVAAKIAQLRERGRTGLLDKVEIVTERISQQLGDKRTQDMTADELELARAQPVRVVEEGAFSLSQLWSVAGPVLEPVALTGLVLVLVMFMLLNREDLRDRVISLVGVGALADTTRALDDAGARVSRYLLMQLLVNGGYGLAVGVGLALIGVPYAALWGFFASLLRYIPYIGPWLAALLPIGLSLLISREWTVALLVVALFGVLELVTNMIVEPLVYGRGLGVSQAALLIAVAFWTWLWGPVGLVLASPLTVCLVVLGRHVPQLAFLDTLLGDRPVLAPSHRLYQRLLAGDEDEAGRLFDEQVRTGGLEQAFDQVVVPMLGQVRSDVRAGKLDDATQRRIAADAAELLDLQRAATAQPQAGDPGRPADARRCVLAVPARDAIDELGVTMLGKVVDRVRIDWRDASSQALVSDVLAQLAGAQVDAVVLVSLPPGGLAHVRYLCKRIETAHPRVPVLVVRPGLYPQDRPEQRQALLAAGATRVAFGLAEADAELNKLAMLD
jgi:predicted PurR-regulated permease PerM